jgi:hypothetical protein
MAKYEFSNSSTAFHPSDHETPLVPVPFISNMKEMEKLDGADTDKTKWIMMDFFKDP